MKSYQKFQRRRPFSTLRSNQPNLRGVPRKIGVFVQANSLHSRVNAALTEASSSRSPQYEPVFQRLSCQSWPSIPENRCLA
jgi:hypothetical protein